VSSSCPRAAEGHQGAPSFRQSARRHAVLLARRACRSFAARYSSQPLALRASNQSERKARLRRLTRGQPGGRGPELVSLCDSGDRPGNSGPEPPNQGLRPQSTASNRLKATVRPLRMLSRRSARRPNDTGMRGERQNPRFWVIGMEQSWNRGGATGGKRSALQRAGKSLDLAPNRCQRLPPAAVWIAW